MKARKRAGTVGKVLGCALLLVIALFPIYWLVAMAIRPTSEMQGHISLIPQSLTIEHFISLFVSKGFGQAAINSLQTTLSSLVLSLIVGVCAAYILARRRFRFSRASCSELSSAFSRIQTCRSAVKPLTRFLDGVFFTAMVPPVVIAGGENRQFPHFPQQRLESADPAPQLTGGLRVGGFPDCQTKLLNAPLQQEGAVLIGIGKFQQRHRRPSSPRTVRQAR